MFGYARKVIHKKVMDSQRDLPIYGRYGRYYSTYQ